MYDYLAKYLQKGLAKEGRFSERLSIFWKSWIAEILTGYGSRRWTQIAYLTHVKQAL